MKFKRIISILLATLALGTYGVLAIGSDDDSSSSDYSYEYNNDSSYRKNVDDAADTFGKDAEDVDNVYHALAGDD